MVVWLDIVLLSKWLCNKWYSMINNEGFKSWIEFLKFPECEYILKSLTILSKGYFPETLFLMTVYTVQYHSEEYYHCVACCSVLYSSPVYIFTVMNHREEYRQLLSCCSFLYSSPSFNGTLSQWGVLSVSNLLFCIDS